MVRRLSIFATLLFFVFAFPTAANVQSGDSFGCDGIYEFLSVVLPPDIVDFLCTISDQNNPVGIEIEESFPDLDLDASYLGYAGQTNPPEEAKQELLLWFLLWTQR